MVELIIFMVVMMCTQSRGIFPGSNKCGCQDLILRYLIINYPELLFSSS